MWSRTTCTWACKEIFRRIAESIREGLVREARAGEDVCGDLVSGRVCLRVPRGFSGITQGGRIALENRNFSGFTVRLAEEAERRIRARACAP